MLITYRHKRKFVRYLRLRVQIFTSPTYKPQVAMPNHQDDFSQKLWVQYDLFQNPLVQMRTEPTLKTPMCKEGENVNVCYKS